MLSSQKPQNKKSEISLKYQEKENHPKIGLFLALICPSFNEIKIAYGEVAFARFLPI
jgi:hypothetical protein